MSRATVCLRCWARSIGATSRITSPPQISRFSNPERRHLRTSTINNPGIEKVNERDSTRKPKYDQSKPWHESVAGDQKKSIKNFKLRQTRTSGTMRPRAANESSEANLRAELRYLNHPVKLAEHVLYTLQHGNENKALALCRLSSKSTANTVSWNHVIDWQMKHGKTNTAMSTFNEMKKRGQRPDSHTYVLLLRGLANYAHHPNSLSKALSLYHSLRAKNNDLPPNNYHVNAVIKVCARANDMESMWDVASNMPQRGAHAANNTTFTTILNYLRINALTDTIDGEASDQHTERIEEAVKKGKQLWAIIVERWREGDVRVDEELVCAMGRLLLIGSRPKDWDNVLSLVQQTMGITRPEAPLGTVERSKSGAPTIRAPETPTHLKENPLEIGINTSEVSDNAMFDNSDPKLTHKLEKSALTPYLGKGLFRYAEPGNNTLSLVLEACLKTILKQAALSYWHLLTNPDKYAVQPDLNNVNMLLRVHRRTGDSTAALALIQDLPRLNVPPSGGTFRLAMNACEKNENTTQALEHARQIIDLMQRTLEEPHIRSLNIYLRLASSQDLHSTVAALRRIWPSIIGLRALVRFGDTGEPVGLNMPKDTVPGMTPASYTQEAVRLFHVVVRCFDSVLTSNKTKFELGPLKRQFKQQKESLEALVQNIEGSSTTNQRTASRSGPLIKWHYATADSKSSKKRASTWSEIDQGNKTIGNDQAKASV